MGQAIVEFEGRFDSSGRLQVYRLPKGDGGGAFEIAGINQRFHPAKARELRALIMTGKHAEARRAAAAYIMNYTDTVAEWLPGKHPAIEFILRDSAFNRGLRGAGAILQIALGLTVDGKVGPQTKAAFALTADLVGAEELAERLTAARKEYERRIFPWKKQARKPGNKFWTGLVNRWAKAHEFGLSLS
jgi:lysozyme family protein